MFPRMVVDMWWISAGKHSGLTSKEVDLSEPELEVRFQHLGIAPHGR